MKNLYNDSTFLQSQVASRVQKIEVYKKGCNFASWSCFASNIMKKHFFSWRKEMAFFPYFHYETIFCWAELFECAFNFEFCYNIFKH